MVPQLKLNLSEGSVVFRFTPEAARELQVAITNLRDSLKVTTTPSSKPSPKPSLEYCHTGEVFLEIFCNPNIWPSPFAAKVLITLRDERIRLSTEAELTRLTEDVQQFLEQYDVL
jgi:hypothetical protein